MSNNKENLISLADRTTEEQRAIACAGGKASGEARRKKKAFREQVIAALETPMSKEWKDAMEANHLGSLLKNMDDNMQTALIASMIGEVLANGNFKAFESLVALAGEKPVDQKQVELSGEVKQVTAKDIAKELMEDA